MEKQKNKSLKYEEISICTAIRKMQEKSSVLVYIPGDDEYSEVIGISAYYLEYSDGSIGTEIAVTTKDKGEFVIESKRVANIYKLFIERNFFPISIDEAIKELTRGYEKIFIDGNYIPVRSIRFSSNGVIVEVGKRDTAIFEFDYNEVQFMRELTE